jgi:hypothetical protein
VAEARSSINLCEMGVEVVVAVSGSSGIVQADQPRQGVALIGWLTLLGWQVVIEHDGNVHVGVARHVTAAGDELVVGGCGVSKAEAVWQLFEAAMNKLGADDTAHQLLSSRGPIAA